MSSSISNVLKHSPAATGRAYPYRGGFAMFPSAEQIVVHEDFAGGIASNKALTATAAVIDDGATLTASATLPHTAVIASDGTAEGVTNYYNRVVLANGAFFAESRFKTFIDGGHAAFNIGAATGAQTNPEDFWRTASTDLVAFGFEPDTGSALRMLVDVSNGGAAQIVSDVVIEDDTWYTLGLYADRANVVGYLNGKEVLRWANSANIPVNAALRPFFGGLTGGDADNQIHVDYFRFAAHRG